MSEDEDFKKHHLPQPCTFCPNMAEYSPLHELDAISLRDRLAVYFCHNCRAEYLFYQDGSLCSTSLYTRIKGKMYRWTVLTNGSAMLWMIKNPGQPGISINRDLSPIKGFDVNDGDVIPDVNPKNINEKIKTWLVFL